MCKPQQVYTCYDFAVHLRRDLNEFLNNCTRLSKDLGQGTHVSMIPRDSKHCHGPCLRLMEVQEIDGYPSHNCVMLTHKVHGTIQWLFLQQQMYKVNGYI